MLEQSRGQHEWIDKVRTEGVVPLIHLDQCSTGWSSPPGDIFLVRGADYLRTKSKIPGGDYLLQPLGFDWIKGPAKISDLLSNPKGRVRRALGDEHLEDGRKPFVWAFNLQLPTKENYSVVSYFVATGPSEEDSLTNQFLKGDDEFKRSRLKLIANVVKGPWIVKKAIGEQAICIIGRTLTCNYSSGENFIEIDIDVGSSVVATAIVHLALGHLTTLSIDIAFLIEGQTEIELPERILGAYRFSHLDPSLASQVELPSEGSSEILESSLPSKLWKTLGDGISHLIHPEAQGSDANASASHTNEPVDHDTSSRDTNKP